MPMTVLNKELVAVAVSVAAGCRPCTTYHLAKAREAGASDADLEKAVALTPDDPTIHEHIGDVYFQTRDFKKALKMYNKALLLGHPEEEKLKKKISKTKERI
ncbi:MAG: carboxymuconolactone decarboxylase family protein [Alphaproteobacteria bacterium]